MTHGARLGVLFWVASAWVVLVVVAALTADLLPLSDPLEMNLEQRAVPPGTLFWFGTDALGRDMFARIIHGARVSIVLGLLVPPIAMLLGLLVGTLAAYVRGPVDRMVVSMLDSYMAFPGLVLYLALISFLGASLTTLYVVFCLGQAVWFSRLARANALVLVEREFVLAARSLGASRTRIVLRELLPNVALPLLALSPLLASAVIAAEGALSFLGLSVPPPTPTWGNMIDEGRADLIESPHIALVPIGVLFVTVLSFNLIGDGLRKRYDVRGSAL